MIAIIKYDAGNTRSVANALERLGKEYIITASPDVIQSADKVILPGVGHAASALNALRTDGIDELLPTLTQPVLGICLGLQLMCRSSEEGNTECLGIFNSEVRLFPPKLNVPHTGWNSLYEMTGEMFGGLDEGVDQYFVHSFYATISPHTVAQTDYILNFSSALQRDNFYAVQFHPEKSAKAGEIILKNFVAL